MGIQFESVCNDESSLMKNDSESCFSIVAGVTSAIGMNKIEISPIESNEIVSSSGICHLFSSFFPLR